MSKSIVIIGAGVGGMAAAIRLAHAGCKVTVVEKNPRVGGKMNLWEVPHPTRADELFRFDTGPTLLTLPQVFEDLFKSVGAKLQNHVQLIRLDPIARFQWPDGVKFEIRAAPEAQFEEVRRVSSDNIEGWRRLVHRGKDIWDISSQSHLFQSPEQMFRKIGLLGRVKMLRVPFRIGMFKRYSGWINKELSSEHLRDVMYSYASYAGSSPFKAPATLTVIPYVEMHFGGWHVRGGMYQLAAAMEKVARQLGVQFRLNSVVKQILVDKYVTPHVRGHETKGVKLLNGEEIKSDVVIANSDVVYTYRELIDPKFRRKFKDKELTKLSPGSSAYCMMLGLDGTYPHLAHHNKFLPEDYAGEIRSLFDSGQIPEDPSIYVCAPTRTDPSLAPKGCEALFVMAPTPSLDGRVNWNSESAGYRKRLIKLLENRWGLAKLSQRIVVEKVQTPAHLETLYNANAGSIYGLDSNSRKNAFSRPPNRDRDIRNLYFVGGATHPGGGLPLVALSGKIVSEMILEDGKTSK